MKIKQKLERLLEEIYDVSIEELPTSNLFEITRYAEATRAGLQPAKWKSYVLKRDQQGFTLANDQHIELLLKTEELFNITIKDDGADTVFNLADLEKLVMTKLKDINDQNREKYFRYAADHANKIKLIIVGQDPYPNDQNGIPFCKDELKKTRRGSLKIIMKSFGEDIYKFYLSKTEIKGVCNGKEVFYELINRGILFFNISHELLSEKNKIPSTSIEENIRYFIDLNKGLKKDKKIGVIVLSKTLGERFKQLVGSKLKESGVNNFTFNNTAIHPSPLNRRGNPEKWSEVWGEKKQFLYNYLNEK